MTTTKTRSRASRPSKPSPASPGSDQISPQAIPRATTRSGSPAGIPSLDGGHTFSDAQPARAAVESTPTDSPTGQDPVGAQKSHARGGTSIDSGQCSREAHKRIAAVEQSPPGPASTRSTTKQSPPVLADPMLALLAEILDDLESTHQANSNRLRQLTRTGVDKDGEERGFGLDESHPDVARLAGMVDALGTLKDGAALNLKRAMRKHPLGPWCKAHKGVGEKQLARLLAAIGDPYWNTLHDRPRLTSELIAYSGLHNVPAGHRSPDTQSGTAGGDPIFVAARRRKGVKANWSTNAKTRSYLIAESCMKQLCAACKRTDEVTVHGDDCICSPYRVVYDARKAATVGRLHAVECVRCGPSGRPAPVGSPWSDKHRHQDALRITSKELLKDLWRESKRIHEAGVTDGHFRIAPPPRTSTRKRNR